MNILSFLRRLFRPLAAGRGHPPARASDPIRISCTDMAAVPAAGDLGRMAVAGRHVVLQFPPSSEGGKKELVGRLASLLPGHSVFDSGPGPEGTTCVTVHKVIDEGIVSENLHLFLAAVRDFSETADALCRRLAEAHGIEPAELFARRGEVEGRLGEWEVDFHGFECCFTSSRSGQVVDVPICSAGEFGVLDPYFLARFMRTTVVHRKAAALLGDDFHDACRMLEVLKARGHLREVKVASEVFVGRVHRGLALASGGEEG